MRATAPYMWSVTKQVARDVHTRQTECSTQCNSVWRRLMEYPWKTRGYFNFQFRVVIGARTVTQGGGSWSWGSLGQMVWALAECYETDASHWHIRLDAGKPAVGFLSGSTWQRLSSNTVGDCGFPHLRLGFLLHNARESFSSIKGIIVDAINVNYSRIFVCYMYPVKWSLFSSVKEYYWV